eukprot:c13143_g1_i2.p1 GENE.c13143_g1_i2~~c13143_g1_i2.p1  ORF type:complete len:2403 (-),score=490.76 c13143_g1_i2:73-7281(-)
MDLSFLFVLFVVLGGSVTDALPTASTHHQQSLLISRSSAFLGARANTQQDTNSCHNTKASNLAQTEILKQRSTQLLPEQESEDSITASTNGEIQFCYSNIVADSQFQLIGSRHRPLLPKSVGRFGLSNSNLQAKFGNNATFAAHNCLYFGSINDPDFVDTQGWMTQALPGLPLLAITGSLSVGINTRPEYEDQTVEWMVFHSSTSDLSESIQILQNGTFKTFREGIPDGTKGIFAGGKIDLAPIVLHGFEKGMIGLYVRVLYALNPAAHAVRGRNLLLQDVFANNNTLMFWNSSVNVFVVNNGDSTWGGLRAPLGDKFVVLQKDRSAISQQLDGGRVDEWVDISFACASTPNHPSAPVQVYVDGVPRASVLCPSGKFQYFSTSFRLDIQSPVLSFINTQGGSVSKCDVLVASNHWVAAPSNLLPCTATTELGKTCDQLSAMAFLEARQLCSLNGGRLCSVSEISNGAGLGGNCGTQIRGTVWTNEACGTGAEPTERILTVTRPGSGIPQVKCLSRQEVAVTMCCADSGSVVENAVMISHVTIDQPQAKDTNGLFSVCDDGIVLQYSPPASLESSFATSSQTFVFTPTPTPTPSGTVQSVATPPATTMGPIRNFDFTSGTLSDPASNTAIADVCGINAQNKNGFVTTLVNGKQQTVYRFNEGSGFVIPNLNSVMQTGDQSTYTLAFYAKFENTGCFVRLLNLDPGTDNGLYLCEGLQLVPERSAGHVIKAREWHHIAISTATDRNSRLYIDGRLVLAWKPSKASWAGLKISRGFLVLFNDCGNQCGCVSEENASGWIASVRLYNRVLSDDEVDSLYSNIVLQSGILAEFDFTRQQSLENILDGDVDLIDMGGDRCSRAATFVQDTHLRGIRGLSVLYVPPSSALQIVPSAQALPTRNIYTLLLKFSMSNVPNCMATLLWFGSSGLKLCGSLRSTSSSGTSYEATALVTSRQLLPRTWYTLVLVVNGNSGASVYIDGVLDFRVPTAQASFSIPTTGIQIFNSDPLAVCDSAACGASAIEGKVAQAMFWNRALTYSEVAAFTNSLGTELKFTASSQLVGLPVSVAATAVSLPNEPCEFSSNVECSSQSPVCFAGPSGNSGYCLPGGGHVMYPSISINGHDIGPCAGGLIGCQLECSKLFDCIGFTIPKCGSVNKEYSPLISPAHFTATGSASVTQRGSGASVVCSQAGGSCGAVSFDIAIAASVEYSMILTHIPDSLIGSARMTLSDNVGVISTSDSTTLTRDNPSMNVRFTPRSSTIRVLFSLDTPSAGDALEIANIQISATSCAGKSGEMAQGILKAKWMHLEASTTTDLFRKVSKAPIVDLDPNSQSFSNVISTAPTVSDGITFSTSSPQTVFISNACTTVGSSCIAATNELRTFAPVNSNGLQLDGSRKNCAGFSPAWTPASAWRLPRPAPCASATGCNTAKTFSQAQSICANMGARLCSYGEVLHGVGNSLTCSFGATRVWTSTPCKCSANSTRCTTCGCDDCRVTIAAATASQTTLPKECASVTQTKNVICCSDQTLWDKDANEAAGGCSYEVGVAYQGPVVREIEQSVLTECCAECFRDSSCAAWVLTSDGLCQLMQSAYPRTTLAGAVSGVTRAKTVHGSGFHLVPSINIVGGDFQTSYVTTNPATCAADCASSLNCVAFTFDATNKCWLKSVVSSSLTSAVSVNSGIRAGSRYVRVKQLTATQNGQAWGIRRIEMFSDFDLITSATPTTAIASTNGTHFPEHAISRDSRLYWQSTTTTDSWLALDFQRSHPYPNIRSLYVQSLTNQYPSSFVVQESDDGVNWRTIMKVRDVREETLVNVFGLGGGKGSHVINTYTLPKGSGIGLQNITAFIPSGTYASYSILARMSRGMVDDASSGYFRITNSGSGDHGLYTLDNKPIFFSSIAASGFMDPQSFHGIALSINSANQNARVILDGSEVANQVCSTWTTEFNLEDSTLRLFNDVALTTNQTFQCSSSLEDAAVKLARGLVFNRELSTAESSSLLIAQQPQCKHATCNGHGTCVNGACICSRTFSGGWKGELCDVPACPGIPECSSHGTCQANGVCLCQTGFKGSACEMPTCPGVGAECSGHGSCQNPDGICVCNSGWRSLDCSLHGCPSDAIVNGALVECSGHGTCNTSPTSPLSGLCTCSSGYREPNCNTRTCPGDIRVSYGVYQDCNNHGSCNTATATCTCCNARACSGNSGCTCAGSGDPGFRGTACETFTCTGDTFVAASNTWTSCSGQGTCSSYGVCSCNQYYYGSGCGSTYNVFLGNDVITRASVDIAPSCQFFDSSLVFSRSGVVTGWSVFSKAAATIYAQVWRAYDNGKFYLVGQTTWYVSGTGLQSRTLSASEYITVRAGDYLGWGHPPNTNGVIAYVGTGSTVNWRCSSDSPGVGNQLDFNGSGARTYSIKASWRQDP